MRRGTHHAAEREVIQLLAEGNSNKETASALGVSVKTIEAHRAKHHAEAAAAIGDRSRPLRQSATRSSSRNRQATRCRFDVALGRMNRRISRVMMTIVMTTSPGRLRDSWFESQQSPRIVVVNHALTD